MSGWAGALRLAACRTDKTVWGQPVASRMDASMRAEHELSTMRLYGSAIAIVSGLYAIYAALMGAGMQGSAWFMFVLGAIVFVHGAVLLTPASSRLGSASGPLMITYAVLMLVHQGWLASGDGMAGGTAAMRSTMGWDLGMVAIALLMLVSGVIMTVRMDDEEPSTGM